MNLKYLNTKYNWDTVVMIWMIRIGFVYLFHMPPLHIYWRNTHYPKGLQENNKQVT